MKTIKFFLLIILALSFPIGCSESFLDDPKPTTSISAEEVYATDAGVRSHFNGIYKRLRSQYSNLAGSYNRNPDAWGIVSVNLSRVAKGSDIVVVGHYQLDYQHIFTQPTYIRPSFLWTFWYGFINQANVLIDGVEKSETLTAASKEKFIAEARALRAWCYFELIRDFQFSYAKDPSLPGLPIYKEPTNINTKGNPRGTVMNVYEEVINPDLVFAVQHLGVDRPQKSNINIDVAWGLLARVYLEQGRWSDARDAAVNARRGNAYPLTSAEYTAKGFGSISSKEWLWGFPMDEADSQTTYYGNPTACWGMYGSGYHSLFINDLFVQQFSNTDKRKLFYTYTSGPRAWATSKFGTVTDFSYDVVMMRSAEMILIEAEARARLNDADAATLLYSLQLDRDASAVASGNTGDDLIKEILLERRKELYGEFGVAYLDAKRTLTDIVRAGNHVSAQVGVIHPDDNCLNMMIPKIEIDANVSITEADQNPSKSDYVGIP